MFLEEKAKGEVTNLVPSPKTLAYVLRYPELWPKGFEWDYTRTVSCAMGMADELWGCGAESPYVARHLGMRWIDAWHIFIMGNRALFGWGWKRTEPWQIARALERL